MRSFLPILAIASAAQALHFFIDGATQKCFYEELPKDTLVSGKYAAEEWDDRVNVWQQHEGIKIYITVDVRPADGVLLVAERQLCPLCIRKHRS